MSRKTDFRSISLCNNFFEFMLLRHYMKIVVNFVGSYDWSALPALYFWRRKVYFGLRPFSLLYLPLSLVVRLHIKPLLTM